MTPPAEPDPAALPTDESATILRSFRNGAWLEQDAPELAAIIEELAWVQDGLDDIERSAIVNILYMATTSIPLASSILSLDWVRNGVDEREGLAIEDLLYADVNRPEVAESIAALGWVKNGVHDENAEAIRLISGMGTSGVAEGSCRPAVDP